MKKTLVSLMVVILLGGCFSTPVGFRIQEPGGYNFTTGNQRDVHSFERYANGQVAVKITLRLLEIPGSVYEPAFDWAWFLDRIGHPDSTLLDEPIIHAIDDGILIEMRIKDAEDQPLTLWVINLNSPFDVWAEVRGDAKECTQALQDWIEVWETLEFIYF